MVDHRQEAELIDSLEFASSHWVQQIRGSAASWEQHKTQNGVEAFSCDAAHKWKPTEAKSTSSVNTFKCRFSFFDEWMIRFIFYIWSLMFISILL